MKTPLHILNLRRVLAAGIVLAACGDFAGAQAPPQDTSATPQRLQDQLDQQTKRIDRLYKAIGPQLAELEERAAAVEKQQQEDKAPALEPIREVADESLTSIGCVNPAAAEFGVITRAGAVRILDAAGKSMKELQKPGQEISCLAFSPNGSEMLTGTDSGALLVWDVAKDTCLTVCTNVGQKVARVAWLGNDRMVWGSTVKGHSNWVVSLAFSADSKRLISGAGDSTARIWDVERGKEMGRIRFQGESSYVDGVGLSPKGDVAFAVARGILVVARVPAAK